MIKLSRYIQDPLRILYGVVRRIAPWIKNDERYLKILFFLRHRKRLNLKHPETFSEKLQWLKLHDRKPEYTTMVDKYAVKEYVANIIGEEYIIPTIGVWDKPEDIDWDCLPDKFVLKTTHGGGSVGVVICKDKNSFNKEKAIRNLSQSLKQNIYTELREWPYKDVRKRIIAETFLDNKNKTNNQELIDYKFFCFNGKMKVFKIDFNRHSFHQANYYASDFELLDLEEIAFPRIPSKPFVPPQNFEDMIKIAESLSSNIPFLRVDLYNISGRIYFSELTFFPASGLGKLNPAKWDYKLGSWLKLPKKL